MKPLKLTEVEAEILVELLEEYVNGDGKGLFYLMRKQVARDIIERLK